MFPEQMKRRSPTLEGFQTIFRIPELGLAEIAWRWTFGVAVIATVMFSVRAYLFTLPVTRGDMLLLRTGQPALILRAILRIFHGSAPRASLAFVILGVALTIAWIVLASLGRAATVKTLFEYFPDSAHRAPRKTTLGPLLALNSFRAAATLAAAVGIAGAMLAASLSSSSKDPSPGRAFLVFWILTLMIGAAWIFLNWYLSLAAIFVAGDRVSTFSALSSATSLCLSRPGALLAIATSFGAGHLFVAVIASSVSAFPLGFAEVLPGGVVFGGLLLVGLLYFISVDFLYAGRLAAYVFLIDQPMAVPVPQSEDDILSDIPGLIPEPY
jgi:hypothetical protein